MWFLSNGHKHVHGIQYNITINYSLKNYFRVEQTHRFSSAELILLAIFTSHRYIVMAKETAVHEDVLITNCNV